MIELMLVASMGLETLAWTGSPSTLQRELTAVGITSRRITRNDFGNGAGGTRPTADVFVHNSSGSSPDFLAPSGVELQLGDGSRQDGSKWAMFEPFYYPDHFLIEYKDGTLERWDVGSDEGHCMPFQVKVVSNVVRRVDNNAVVQRRGGSRGNCGDAMARAISGPSSPTMESCGTTNQILMRGSCVDCGTGMGYASNACVACTNTEKQVAGSGGGFVCEACGTNMESTADRTSCIPTQKFCNDNNQIRKSNMCESCTGDTPIRVVNECQPSAQICNDKNQVLIRGACQPCDATQVRNENMCLDACPRGKEAHRGTRACGYTVASCASINQILPTRDGVCAPCAGATPIRDGNRCVASCDTAAGEANVNGACVTNRESCRAINKGFFIGRCATCAENYVLDLNNNRCLMVSQSNCNAVNQIYRNGACEPCMGDTPIRVSNECQPSEQICNNKNQILVSGACQSCSTGQRLSGNSCVETAASCNPRNLLFNTATGTCDSCPALQDISATSNQCVSCALCDVLVGRIANLENTVDRLISSGANVNAADSNGQTPLMFAAQQGNTAVVNKLLAVRSINVSARNNAEKTALDLARENNHSDVVAALESATQSANTSARGGGSDAVLYVGLGVVVVGGLYLMGGGDGTFSYAPHYRYNLTDSGYGYSFGTRVNYNTDKWHLYWDANTDDSNIRYGTGAAYNGDFWRAAFSEEVKGDAVDYRFLLSANWRTTNWQFSPTYTLHSYFQDISANLDSDTNNVLSLQGYWRHNRWQISPSASYQWQNIRAFGNTHRFDVFATYEF